MFNPLLVQPLLLNARQSIQLSESLKRLLSQNLTVSLLLHLLLLCIVFKDRLPLEPPALAFAQPLLSRQQ